MLHVLLSYLIPSVSLGKLHIFQIKRSLITLYQKGTMEKNTLKCPITLEKKTGLFGQIAGGWEAIILSIIDNMQFNVVQDWLPNLSLSQGMGWPCCQTCQKKTQRFTVHLASELHCLELSGDFVITCASTESMTTILSNWTILPVFPNSHKELVLRMIKNEFSTKRNWMQLTLLWKTHFIIVKTSFLWEFDLAEIERTGAIS